jgi:hypothetical protein
MCSIVQREKIEIYRKCIVCIIITCPYIYGLIQIKKKIKMCPYFFSYFEIFTMLFNAFLKEKNGYI